LRLISSRNDLKSLASIRFGLTTITCGTRAHQRDRDQVLLQVVIELGKIDGAMVWCTAPMNRL
jgi:hypothetical protein